MNSLQEQELRNTYSDYLLQQQPEYFVTLTFLHPYTTQVAERALNAFVLKLSNRLPSRAKDDFKAMITAELHKDAKFEGSYHFHMVLWGLDQHLPDAYDWLKTNATRAALELHPRDAGKDCDCKQAERDNRKSTCRKGAASCRGPHMCSRNTIDVQQVSGCPDHLARYVTKDLVHWIRSTETIVLQADRRGICGGLDS